MSTVIEDERGKHPAYIATCPTCSLFLGACVDDPKHLTDTANTVRGWRKSGLNVERKTVADVWTVKAWCQCKRAKRRKP